jgi:hypothetical protein
VTELRKERIRKALGYSEVVKRVWLFPEEVYIL